MFVSREGGYLVLTSKVVLPKGDIWANGVGSEKCLIGFHLQHEDSFSAWPEMSTAHPSCGGKRGHIVNLTKCGSVAFDGELGDTGCPGCIEMFPISCKGSFTAGVVVYHSARPRDFAGLKLFCGAPTAPLGVLDSYSAFVQWTLGHSLWSTVTRLEGLIVTVNSPG